jgi:hypothetical protein
LYSLGALDVLLVISTPFNAKVTLMSNSLSGSVMQPALYSNVPNVLFTSFALPVSTAFESDYLNDVLLYPPATLKSPPGGLL